MSTAITISSNLRRWWLTKMRQRHHEHRDRHLIELFSPTVKSLAARSPPYLGVFTPTIKSHNAELDPEAPMTNQDKDRGSLTFEQVLQKMNTCVKQLIVLEMIDKLIEKTERGEDYRPLLSALADYAEAETSSSEDSILPILRGLISSALTQRHP